MIVVAYYYSGTSIIVVLVWANGEQIVLGVSVHVFEKF